jgi:hypothetical protein
MLPVIPKCPNGLSMQSDISKLFAVVLILVVAKLGELNSDFQYVRVL